MTGEKSPWAPPEPHEHETYWCPLLDISFGPTVPGLTGTSPRSREWRSATSRARIQHLVEVR
jgi:hypothetical protein